MVAPMFVDAPLAHRIDRVEAALGAALAAVVSGAAVSPVGGGAAVFIRPGSPVNKVIGLGFEPLIEAELAAIEDAWAARGEPVRIELSTLASIPTIELLVARGYQLRGFECVHVRDLGVTPPAPAIEVERSEQSDTWMQISLDGFLAPDGTGEAVDHHTRAVLEDAMRDMQAAAGFARYLAHLEGRPAGAALMRIHDRLALFAGATTLPAARKRGVQAALLARRLHDARTAGAELAIIVTAPGSRSQHNAIRNGFALGYLRAVLQR